MGGVPRAPNAHVTNRSIAFERTTPQTMGASLVTMAARSLWHTRPFAPLPCKDVAISYPPASFFLILSRPTTPVSESATSSSDTHREGPAAASSTASSISLRFVPSNSTTKRSLDRKLLLAVSEHGSMLEGIERDACARRSGDANARQTMTAAVWKAA